MRCAAAGRKLHGCMLSDPVQLRSYSEQDVFLRLCLPVINEGFKILEGGKLMFPKRYVPVIMRMVLCPSDILVQDWDSHQ